MSDTPRRRRRARGSEAALTRRRFMSLLAAGSAAALVAPAGALAAAAKAPAKGKRSAPATPSPRVLAEIEKQKKSVADTLKAIRGFTLPVGSDMAFEFRPLGRGRKK